MDRSTPVDPWRPPYLRQRLTTALRRDHSLCRAKCEQGWNFQRGNVHPRRFTTVPPNAWASRQSPDPLLVDQSSHTFRRARKRFRHHSTTCSTEPLVSVGADRYCWCRRRQPQGLTARRARKRFRHRASTCSTEPLVPIGADRYCWRRHR